MIFGDIKKWAERQIAPNRIEHVQSVAAMMGQYAERWSFRLEAGLTAAWIHDICRHWSWDSLLAAAVQHGLPVSELEQAYPILLHGPVAAELYREAFASPSAAPTLWCQDTYNAVYYHTTGRPKMSRVEACLYLADAVEAGREYPGVEEVRQLSFIDLDEALLLSMERSLEYLLQRRQLIHPLTVDARNWYLNVSMSKEPR